MRWHAGTSALRHALRVDTFARCSWLAAGKLSSSCRDHHRLCLTCSPLKLQLPFGCPRISLASTPPAPSPSPMTSLSFASRLPTLEDRHS
eukprot:250561-Pleurochrysis_carterae.AAC.1